VPPTPEPSDSPWERKPQSVRPGRPDPIGRRQPPLPRNPHNPNERSSAVEVNVNENPPPPTVVAVEENQVISEPEPKVEEPEQQQILQEESPVVQEATTEEQYSPLSDDVLQSRRNAVKGVSCFCFFCSTLSLR